MEYKATLIDIEFAKQVWESQIVNMVYNPFDLKEAHKRLFGFLADSPQQARVRLNSYFRYQYKAVDKTETASTIGSAANTDMPQSHTEDNKIFKDVVNGGIDKDNPILEMPFEDMSDIDLESKLNELESNLKEEKPKRKRIVKKK